MTLPDRLRAHLRRPTHEPTEACWDVHCHWHRRDEQPGYATCYECGHTYASAWSIRWAYAVGFGWGGWRGFCRRLFTPATEIFFCPLCAHSF